jgi:hypothetical protein
MVMKICGKSGLGTSLTLAHSPCSFESKTATFSLPLSVPWCSPGKSKYSRKESGNFSYNNVMDLLG